MILIKILQKVTYTYIILYIKDNNNYDYYS